VTPISPGRLLIRHVPSEEKSPVGQHVGASARPDSTSGPMGSVGLCRRRTAGTRHLPDALTHAEELRVILGTIGGLTSATNASFGAHAEVVKSPRLPGRHAGRRAMVRRHAWRGALVCLARPKVP
jgi:hypothetical protein